ncbi:Serine--tRNA ligase, mitochondrial [Ophidiomyces ophidiicola]|uniref:Serine--tRNA ligase, mitochondrial n=1 Tax=Ophidiomyces ophidiicola TaxID=1387563 RepID=A0ACB8V3B4_9EURO|nr:Serine--tRNA ligase, mitochondrial [Ophidiomyces ophidiicola]KAI1954704.1 Serine--tRNA ligase, mitochondrial [Ophidiomyces ophidiicola]KAI1973424.1 Serine--tRNA ligase, mitochondrial [Ophidiomyces ophidiicola]KAI2007604.1 Serine--tRNA ligase, mitochondrial [Ophidiomyces ophidiicola]KAI2019608.1 Serine--tRNA ligase, mitochondrial [Ophidiomyces ophidiicola]
MKPFVCLRCRLAARHGGAAAAAAAARWPRAPLARAFSSSPKPVPNVKHVRAHADRYAQACRDRHYAALADHPARIQALADEAAQLQKALDAPRTEIKSVQREIARVAADPDARDGVLDALRAQAKKLKDASQGLVDRRESCVEQIRQLALSLPNLSSSETPVGDIPRIVGYINYDPSNPPSHISSPSRNHVSIGTALGLLDFSSAATSSGWGWYYLINEGALLEQALVQYALSVAMRRGGWTPVAPPTLVYADIAEACGFQPRDANNEQQIWAIEQSEKDKSKPQRCLTGTAEIPLAAMYAGREIPAEKLPMRCIGVSRCYRAEAGARGVDTKGLYRVHEFTKVELFAWADDFSETTIDNTPATTMTSSSLFAEMLSIQTEILTSLNLPCRILEMPTGDLGASAARKQDIEALFPSRLNSSAPAATDPVFDTNGWGELTSASICTDYQSRRLGTRVRSGSTMRFPHTVNGTAVAVPRVLAAILEHGWDEERGVVVVPEVLRSWMGGLETIGRKA